MSKPLLDCKNILAGTHLPVGTPIRIKPREGKIIGVRMTQIKQRRAPNWSAKAPRYTYDEVPTYLVEFEDGSRASLSAWEIEEMEG